MAKDPVCGMPVDEKRSVTTVYHGTTYYFCGLPCKMAFEKSPEKFTGKAGTSAGN